MNSYSVRTHGNDKFPILGSRNTGSCLIYLHGTKHPQIIRYLLCNLVHVVPHEGHVLFPHAGPIAPLAADLFVLKSDKRDLKQSLCLGGRLYALRTRGWTPSCFPRRSAPSWKAPSRGPRSVCRRERSSCWPSSSRSDRRSSCDTCAA